MQIVIEIPKERLESIKKYGIKQNEVHMLVNALITGTPLPEHHGRLIDADEFQKYCFNKNFDKGLSDGGLATINMFLEFAPTILEAGVKANDLCSEKI